MCNQSTLSVTVTALSFCLFHFLTVMSWFPASKDVWDKKSPIKNINNKQDSGFRNGLSYSSVAALTLASVFGHLSYKFFEG